MSKITRLDIDSGRVFCYHPLMTDKKDSKREPYEIAARLALDSIYPPVTLLGETISASDLLEAYDPVGYGIFVSEFNTHESSKTE